MPDLNNFGENTEKGKELNSIPKGVKLFFGEAEAKLFSNLGREISESILKESFLLYRIDLNKTESHTLYGESLNKVWKPEIEIYGRINVESNDTKYMTDGGIVKKDMGDLTAHVYIEHLEELELVEEFDGNLLKTDIKEGDFIGYKNQFYEIYNNGHSNISNEFSWGGDRRFYITIKAKEVDEDVFKAL